MSRMSLEKLLILGGMAISLAGCAAPLRPGGDAPPAAYNSSPPATPGAPGGVIPASATEPVAGQPGYPAAGPAVYPPPAYAPGMAPPGTYAPGSVATAQPVVVAPVSPAPKDEDHSGFDWKDLAPEEIWKNIKKSAGYGPDEKIARQAFQEGQVLFRQKKYAEAAEKFYIASWRWPESKLEEDSQFLLGESYFFNDQYGKAQDAYDSLLKSHDNTGYLDTVMAREFAIARYWEKLDAAHPQWPMTPNFNDKERPWFDTWGNAKVAYETIRLHDPTGPLADSAVMATANMNFRAGHFEEAAHDYDVLRKDYPKSRYQVQAHILGLQSKMATYQGPLYDPKPLKDASVRDTRNRIEVLKAEREWAMGQYYDGKKYYGAARRYYQVLLEKYAWTTYGEQARQRLEQIRNEPDSPPNHFKWLTQVFDHER
jgi:outer membrane protein assembly factor BamD (BamD/ComL family)